MKHAQTHANFSKTCTNTQNAGKTDTKMQKLTQTHSNLCKLTETHRKDHFYVENLLVDNELPFQMPMITIIDFYPILE